MYRERHVEILSRSALNLRRCECYTNYELPLEPPQPIELAVNFKRPVRSRVHSVVSSMREETLKGQVVV